MPVALVVEFLALGSNKGPDRYRLHSLLGERAIVQSFDWIANLVAAENPQQNYSSRTF